MSKKREFCTCPKLQCPRRLNCDVCIEYHQQKGRKPHCERTDFLSRLTAKKTPLPK